MDRMELFRQLRPMFYIMSLVGFFYEPTHMKTLNDNCSNHTSKRRRTIGWRIYCYVVAALLCFAAIRMYISIWVGFNFIPEQLSFKVIHAIWYTQCASNALVFVFHCRDPKQLPHYLTQWQIYFAMRRRFESQRSPAHKEGTTSVPVTSQVNSSSSTSPSSSANEKTSVKLPSSSSEAKEEMSVTTAEMMSLKEKTSLKETTSVKLPSSSSEAKESVKTAEMMSPKDKTSHKDKTVKKAPSSSETEAKEAKTSSVTTDMMSPKQLRGSMLLVEVVTCVFAVFNLMLLGILIFLDPKYTHGFVTVVTSPFPDTLPFAFIFFYVDIISTFAWVFPTMFTWNLCSVCHYWFTDLADTIQGMLVHSDEELLKQYEDTNDRTSLLDKNFHFSDAKDRKDDISLVENNSKVSTNKTGCCFSKTKTSKNNTDNFPGVGNVLPPKKVHKSSKIVHVLPKMEQNWPKKEHDLPKAVYDLSKVGHDVPKAEYFPEPEHQSPKLMDEVSRDVTSREFARHLETLRQLHLQLCACVDAMDTTLRRVLASTYATSIPLICFLLYTLVASTNDWFTAANLASWTTFNFVQSTLISVACARVHEAAHSPLKYLYNTDITATTAVERDQLYLFLSKLSGSPIGFSVLSIRLVTKEMILTLAGMLLTYFFLLLQFKI